MRYKEILWEATQKQRVLNFLAKQADDSPLFSKIYKDVVGGPLATRIGNYIQTRDDKDAIAEIKYLMQTIPTLANIDQLKPWLNNLRDGVDFINIDMLTPAEGMQSPAKLSDTVNDPISKELFSRIAREVRGKADAGPGEAALAILSPQITYAPDDDELGRGGDISVRGAKVEVKGHLGRIWGPFPVDQNSMVKILTKFNPTLKSVTVTQGSKPLPPKFPAQQFITAACIAWFGNPIQSIIKAFGTPNFRAIWHAAIFNYYKRQAKHQGILIIGKATYQYLVDGKQMQNIAIKSVGDLCRPDSRQYREMAPQISMA